VKKLKIGVIDIGSNSIKMIIANTEKGLTIEKKFKDYVLLNEKVNDMLTENRINEAITTLTKFAHECEGTDKVLVIATEAVRSAKNQQEFVDKIKQVVGLNIRVLKGKEEAYYDYFATVNSMNVVNHDLIIDVGGGSTELILLKDGNIDHSISLPFGVVTLTDKFNLHDIENNEQKNELKSYVNKYFDKLDWLKKVKGHNLIGIGGSITNIGRINLKENKQSLELLHTHSIPAEEFKKIYHKLEYETDVERLKEKGLAKEEVDFVVAAAEIVTILIDSLKIKNIIFSKNGVREGLVYKEIEG
jgi:exopolyphosphatase/guanosine-5'-triphosphate,3'-diphosphate pyrophosphatase